MNGMEKSNGWFLQILIKLYLNLIKTFSPQKSLNSLKILAIKIAKVFKFGMKVYVNCLLIKFISNFVVLVFPLYLAN